MTSLQKTPAIFKNSIVHHILFWLGVYAYFIGTVNMSYYSGYGEVLSHYAIYVFCQILVAYTSLYALIPCFLNTKKNVQFIGSMLLLLMLAFVLFVAYHEYYHLPKYHEPKDMPYDSYGIFWEKLLNIRIFIGKSTIILTPTVLLIIAKFYKEKQAYLQLNEQKKITELSALKHQLNPHFLFNTLNNLYALAINKSDEAPEVIAKLSEMLDYMLYGCNEKYVPLTKEIDLIDNYLALEKVRYGDRVAIRFEKNIQPEVKIAPLILLTFIENAFKHGVSQELKKASINIVISVEGNHILFNIANSVTKNAANSTKEAIGLSNVKKQLELLYLDGYSLKIEEDANYFNVHLKLPIK
ncbi:putative two-component system sensor protein, no kinase domain [Tenacibaculum sp. 190130A14a]|uniref:Two-component system, LytTR family, sensor kinase n=1 Tax=Tenacibaculum polynesiense TaxID=3137857 RepID=A0ABP1F2H2_9FLAO